MFGFASKPTRIYSYGANPPTEGYDLVCWQMRAAHRYRNALVELERERRKRVDEALARLSPALAQTEAGIAEAEKGLEDARAAKRLQHAAARKRQRDPEGAARINALLQRLRDLRAKRKELRTTTFASEAWEKAQEEIETWYAGVPVEAAADAAEPEPKGEEFRFEHGKVYRAEDLPETVTVEVGAGDEDAPEGEEPKPKKKRPRRKGGAQKKLRAECGLGWGTYLAVEASVPRRGPPPQFHRWEGGGKLAVQLIGGLDVPGLEDDTQLQVHPQPEGVWVPGTRQRRKLGTAWCWFRIGSNPDASPIWAKVPFHLHRPIPPDASVKWAYLIRRRIATHEEWKVQLVLARDAWPKLDASATGAVGIDVGWRRMEDGSLRVAYWVGSDGQEEDVRLDAGWLQQMRKTEDIRSIRDKNFNEARDALATWLRARRPKTKSELPAEGPRPPAPILKPGEVPPKKPFDLFEETRTLASWHSPARLAVLALRWREARKEGLPPLGGDQIVFDALEAWRKRDRHLYEYEGNLRDQLQGSRREKYRVLAAKLRRRYRVAVVEDMDLREFHVLPKAEEVEKGDAKVPSYVRDACISLLRQCLQESLVVTKANAKNTTKRCHACGVVQKFEAKTTLVFSCACGAVWDQDRNAAINLLRTATGTSEAPAPSAPPSPSPVGSTP